MSLRSDDDDDDRISYLFGLCTYFFFCENLVFEINIQSSCTIILYRYDYVSKEVTLDNNIV